MTDPEINNAEFLKPQNTRWDMIQPITTMTLFIKSEGLKTMGEGLFASLHSDGYSIEIGVKNNEFFIKRNLDVISVSYLLEEQTTDVMFEAHWGPEKLSVVVLDTSF